MARFDDELEFGEVVRGITLASYVDGPVEVKVVKLKEGTEIPMHKHTDNVVHLVLEGELAFDGHPNVVEMGDYKCGGWEYRGMVIKDTTMLIIQPVGTKFVWSDTDSEE